jgi:hypothetical protein
MKFNELATQSKTLEARSGKLQPQVEIESSTARYLDVLAQLKVNILHLEDLSGRIHFLMNEIRVVTRAK